MLLYVFVYSPGNIPVKPFDQAPIIFNVLHLYGLNITSAPDKQLYFTEAQFLALSREGSPFIGKPYTFFGQF